MQNSFANIFGTLYPVNKLLKNEYSPFFASFACSDFLESVC